MHVVFRESRGLEETVTPRDIGQDPADLVVLSFSDSDLAAFASGWRRGRASLPSLRLANLAELRHPLAVDLARVHVARVEGHPGAQRLKAPGGIRIRPPGAAGHNASGNDVDSRSRWRMRWQVVFSLPSGSRSTSPPTVERARR